MKYPTFAELENSILKNHAKSFKQVVTICILGDMQDCSIREQERVFNIYKFPILLKRAFNILRNLNLITN